MSNFEIKQEITGNEIILRCAGRLDANRAVYLNDYIERMVREGNYFISLDLDDIEYLSSAGIRSLVTQFKNLKAVNGHFRIGKMSENVYQVLDMVGMMEMLTRPAQKNIAAGVEQGSVDQLNESGFHFKRIELSGSGNTTALFYGRPEEILNYGFEPSHARKVESAKNHFAIGMGAIGSSFSDCKDLFGEYLMLGETIAYLPADGSKKPDYMVSSGKLVAPLTELYGIHFDGNFSLVIRFEQENPQNTIGLTQLVTTIRKLTGYKQLGLVMLAESGGLIGTSLNIPPVGGKEIFNFPEIKNNINFTTEPAHIKKLILAAGYFSTESGEESKFLRPLEPGSPLLGHIHTAVFPYTPLKKTDIDLDETIGYLFNNSEVTDLLHLANDTREITGLGESQFMQGFCWVVPVESKEIILNR
jgi:anti-anti-sigma factor